ncbi:hypothetical protein GFY24_01730 [Nocardia sp. SYP-A9097]|uniref:hypothetical protein n=1 Tax=Nocardia sp. SYP-A9097 TaxID=2663237 RepID=UPI00129BD187|nr:hypothetical protein [Nocardia sp. SYP-A9097]MRH86196.1 hypothetical protein [Nocardia sp. SYP-A9097]
MDLIGRSVAARVGYAMVVSGVDLHTLADRTGFDEDDLARRLRSAASFQLDELVLIAGALGGDPLELLPAFGPGDRAVAGVAA